MVCYDMFRLTKMENNSWQHLGEIDPQRLAIIGI